MKIDSIYIENFRGIHRFEISNLACLNVIAGINGAGKSSVLIAARILLSWLIARIRNAKGRGIGISDKDITIGESYCLLKMRLDNGVSWQIYKQHSKIRSASEYKTDMGALTQLANSMAEKMGKSSSDQDITLIDAYGVNRMVRETPMRIRKMHKLSPLDALSADVSESVNFHDFFIWFREKEDIENEQYRNSGVLVLDKQLDAVRQTVEKLFPGYSDFRVQRSPKAFVIRKGKITLDFNLLSDGEKAYLALMLDIARKLAMTHSSLEAPLLGDGIILIDEIDLHLHPSWQREVVGNIQRAFPNCQFILTTHSPQVVSCVDFVKGDKLITISNGEAYEETGNQYGQEPDMVLAEIFQMQSLRNPDVQERINIIWDCLKNKDFNSNRYINAIDWLKEHVDLGDKIFAQIKLQEALIKKGM